MSLSSRFVTNDVQTPAPFSYVTVTPTGIAVQCSVAPENRVRAGANKKNFMFLSI